MNRSRLVAVERLTGVIVFFAALLGVIAAIAAGSCATGSDPGEIYLTRYVDVDGGVCPTTDDAGTLVCPPTNDAGTIIVTVYQECQPGLTRPCYSGDGGLDDAGLGIGACRPGMQPCMESDAGADAGPTWGPCIGEIDPQAEDCSGLDKNCNGTPNDVGGACTVMIPGVFGACARSNWECMPGSNAPQCPQTTFPQTECCGCGDANCDGQVDNVAPLPCATGLPGLCATGTAACADGGDVCIPTWKPGQLHEDCTGRNYDCNCDGVLSQNDDQCCCSNGSGCDVHAPGDPAGSMCIGQCISIGGGPVCEPYYRSNNCLGVPQ